MLELRPAPDAKYWRHLWSVQLLIIGAAFSGVASVIGAFGGLQFAQDHPFLFCGIAAGVNILALGARLIDQRDIPHA